MSTVAYGETVEILTPESKVVCLVLNVEAQKIGAIVLDADTHVKPGQFVISRDVLLSVPTGEALLGRIINPLGKPVDDKGPIAARGHRWSKL